MRGIFLEYPRKDPNIVFWREKIADAGRAISESAETNTAFSGEASLFGVVAFSVSGSAHILGTGAVCKCTCLIFFFPNLDSTPHTPVTFLSKNR